MNLFVALLNVGYLGVDGSWRRAAQCKHCRAIEDLHVEPCRACGEITDFKEAAIVARPVWKGKWYNPFSWYKIKWQVKGDSK